MVIPDDRRPCCIPGCRRTFKVTEGDGEIMCGRHWRTAPKPMRARMTELRRMYRRRPTDALLFMIHRQWGRIKVEVIAATEGAITDTSAAAFFDAL